MAEKTYYLEEARIVRKYVLQTLKELKHGFTDEVDIPTFYDIVDSLDELCENNFRQWSPFIERLKNEVEEYKNINESTDFLIEYLFKHLDSIEEREKPKNKITPSNPNDLIYIEKLLPKINEYLTKDSTIEDWRAILEHKEPNRIINILCKNKLLGEFIAELKRKRQLSNADSEFGKYFGLSHRFLEVATKSMITENDKEILDEIFTSVQK